MIDQFFTEEEGTDRDWQQYDYISDLYGEDDDRAKLIYLP